MLHPGDLAPSDVVDPRTPAEVGRDVLARFSASRANFHLGGGEDWSVSPETIRFLADHTPIGGITLETGAGLSTVLFAALGGRHVCICPDESEAERIRAYCRMQGVTLEGLQFVQALSEKVLPTLETPPLDLVLIDGGHGFPMPIIDWYYTADKLKIGGVLVIDDTHLWSASILIDFLKTDAGWLSLGRIGRRTFGFRKCAAFEYREFCFQPYVVRKSRVRGIVARALTGWDMLRAGEIRDTARRVRKMITQPDQARRSTR